MQLESLPKNASEGSNMSKFILESVVAGLVTLVLLALVGSVCYIAIINTPNFIVQHSIAIFQGIGTAFGTFIAGALLRRIKVARRILHRLTCKRLFREEPDNQYATRLKALAHYYHDND
jgi:hypothetical protein